MWVISQVLIFGREEQVFHLGLTYSAFGLFFNCVDLCYSLVCVFFFFSYFADVFDFLTRTDLTAVPQVGSLGHKIMA